MNRTLTREQIEDRKALLESYLQKILASKDEDPNGILDDISLCNMAFNSIPRLFDSEDEGLEKGTEYLVWWPAGGTTKITWCGYFPVPGYGREEEIPTHFMSIPEVGTITPPKEDK